MDLDSAPLVSILTPVYNCEKYIGNCIESILSQTYKNWEYVIVNNCSTDRSLHIAQEYAQKDNRIKIHSNKNFVGAIENHNIAIKQIAMDSKYFLVLHADDCIAAECLAQKVQLAEENPSVGIVGSYHIEGQFIPDNLFIIPYPTSVVAGREICRYYLLNKSKLNLLSPPSAHLIRSEYVKNNKKFYNPKHLAADMEVCYEILRDSDFGFVHQVLTYLGVHKGQSSASAITGSSLLLGKIFIVDKHGSSFLNPQEHERCLRKHWSSYYGFFAYRILKPQFRKLWRQNNENLNKLGYSLDYTKLLKAILARFFRIFIHPGKILNKFFVKKNAENQGLFKKKYKNPT